MTRLLISWHLTHGSAGRAALCALAIVLAFFLFVLTDAIGARLENGEIRVSDERLMVVHKHALSESLPLSYLDRIAAVPGVAGVTPRQSFGGWFRDPANTFTQYLVEPRRDLALHPDYRIAPGERAAFEAGGKGVLVGRSLAERFGWKIGDNLSLGSVWLSNSNPATLALTVVGIFDAGAGAGGEPANTDLMLIDRGYFVEAVPYARTLVGWYVVARTPDSDPAQVAAAIDALFENSRAPTTSSTERALSQRMAQQLGDVTRIGLATSFASFLSLVVAVALYFWQNMTERADQIGVLRAMGFTDLPLFGFLLAGSLMLCVGAALAGCLLAALCLPAVAAALDSVLPGIQLAARTWYRAIGMMLLLGVFGALLAGLRMRHNKSARAGLEPA